MFNLKNLAVAITVMVAATNIANAQENNSSASVKYDFTAVAESGDTAVIDMSYVNLADAFGGKPYDVVFKNGEPRATIITGWGFGVKGGYNSYLDKSYQYGIFVQNYFLTNNISYT